MSWKLSVLAQTAVSKGIFTVNGDRITYHISTDKSYQLSDPEEQVRADTIAFLIIDRGYDSKRLGTEVVGSHNDFADVVIYEDDQCTVPWLVVENKKEQPTKKAVKEGIGQAFANAIALGADFALFDDGSESFLWKVKGFGAKERKKNLMGGRDATPKGYANPVTFTYIAGGPVDISASDPTSVATAVKRAHSIIWAGGKRDPLAAFDEWSKLMFAKVRDERYTPTGEARSFQVGIGEPNSQVAFRVRRLYEDAVNQDATIFPSTSKLLLDDDKIAEVVQVMQAISFIETDSDIIGRAFEDFFGTAFRGGLGQYFTPRQVARFTVAALEPTCSDFCLDPTAGSGGFLLETLLQVWRGIDGSFQGQSGIQRKKDDFAKGNVYGVEIHPSLARICKVSLILHHDGHTNIEADKSCLAPSFTLPRLNQGESFDVVVGNPPFGSKIHDGDADQLEGRSLKTFEVASNRDTVPSEQLILERSIEWLKPGGCLGMVLPDGLLNNSGDGSGAPAVRRWLFTKGRILGVVSLPDHAFRHSGATNKTSVLFFERFSKADKAKLTRALATSNPSDSDYISAALAKSGLDYQVFFAEADEVGYTPSGANTDRNDLYRGDGTGNQDGTILGDWRKFRTAGMVSSKNCTCLSASEVWEAHPTHRIDPKYHVYMSHAADLAPDGWMTKRLGDVVRRKKETVDFSQRATDRFSVLTLSIKGQIRLREAGIGNNPPEWLGMYFEDSASKWYVAHTGDIIYSGIDLWKGAVAYVGKEFDGGLVTSEYPVLEVISKDIDPEFLALLLRSAPFQRAFRAINTGHSNRRRTQPADFNEVLIFYPDLAEQKAIAAKARHARSAMTDAELELLDLEENLLA